MLELLNVCKNHTMFKLQWTRIKKKQFIVYDSDTPVTWKRQDHQTWYQLVDPKQGNNYAKFEKPHLNRVREKANDKVFVKSGNMSYLP